MNKKENEHININSSHPIVKSFYYKLFSMLEPNKKPALNSVNYLLGPGGVGKTHSSKVAVAFLNLVGIKSEVVHLNKLSSIGNLIGELGNNKVIIFDALNESVNPIGIKKEIEGMIDNETLIIINSRESKELNLSNEKNLFEIDYKTSFQSFVNENRIFDDNLKNELWKTILKFYNPIFSGYDFEFKTNLRTLRLLYEAIVKFDLVDKNDDAVIQIRNAYEQVIKRDLLNNRESWNVFKKSIYDFDKNEICLSKIPQSDIDILEEYDLLRYNNGNLEIRDYNIIDHIISLEIINRTIKDKLISLKGNDFERDLRFLSNYVNNINGYFSNRTTLRIMLIYQYMFRVSHKDGRIKEELINRLIQNWETRELGIMSVGLMKFSRGRFDYLKGFKVHTPSINVNEYFELSEFFYVIFGKVVPQNYSEDPFINNSFDSNNIAEMTIENNSNIVFNSNVMDMISYLVSKGEESQTFSNYLASWIDGVVRSNVNLNINEVIRNSIAKKGLERTSGEYAWRHTNRTTYHYSFMLIAKIIQIHLSHFGDRIFTIEESIFERMLKNTFTFKNLNKVTVVNKDSLSIEDRKNGDEDKGILSPDWPKSLLDNMCQLTNSSTEYHCNKGFLEFTKEYSKKYSDKILDFGFYTKNKYILDDGHIRDNKNISETLAFDNYLFENGYKTLATKDLGKSNDEDEVFYLGGYRLYFDSWSNNSQNVKNIYKNIANQLPEDIQKHFNVLISNTDNIDLILSNIESFSKKIVEANITLITHVNPNKNIQTHNNSGANYILVTMRNDETYEKYCSEYQNDWIEPTLKNILNGSEKDFYYDGNRTLFTIEPYSGRRYFKSERRYSSTEVEFGKKSSPEWSQIVFTIEEDSSFVARIFTPKKSVEYNSKAKELKDIRYESATVDYIK